VFGLVESSELRDESWGCEAALAIMGAKIGFAFKFLFSVKQVLSG
jgi:hypothetical protein